MEPYFELVDNGVEVTMEPGYNVYMDEEMEVPLEFLYINYDGTATIQISIINGPSGIVTVGKTVDERNVVVLIVKQDYEMLDLYRFIIEVRINNVAQRFNLNIVNILDNDPIVSYNGPCQIDVSFNTHKLKSLQLQLIL